MLKKDILNKKISNFIWLFFHGIIVCMFLFSLSKVGLNLSSDFMQMIPDSSSYEFAAADKKLAEENGRKILVLSSGSDFEKAREGAVELCDALKVSKRFDKVSLYQNKINLDELENFIFKNRFKLTSIGQSSSQDFADNALSKIFGAFTFTSLNRLGEDPFLLVESAAENYMTALGNSLNKLGPKEDVLAVEYEEKWYVLCTLTLSDEGALLSRKKSGLAELYRLCAELEEKGYSFVFTGSPLHSYESSLSASREISIISTLSLLLVSIVLLLVFKSFLPLFMPLLSICISLFVAFAATHSFFSYVHILTLIFGTSLIGSCIDYSLHFFIQWKANPCVDSGWQIRNFLFKGLLLSLVSTEICYFMLLFSPFAILKQMAVFSFFGVLSSFLTAVCIFPNIKIQKKEKRRIFIFEKICSLMDSAKKSNGKKIPAGKIFSWGLFVFSLLVISLRFEDFSIKNNIANLYKMSGKVKENTILSAKIMGYSNPCWFIVKGKSCEEVLQHEESLLDSLRAKELNSFIAASLFIPSKKTQEENYEKCRKLLPLLSRQMDFLGFGKEDANMYEEDFKKASSVFVSPEDKSLPDTIKDSLSNLYLGKIGESYFSLVMLSPGEEVDFKSFVNSCRLTASDMDYVFFENKAVDISLSLDKLSLLIIKMFAIAYFIIIVILKAFYSWKESLKILLVPVKSVLFISAVFILAGRSIDFFCIIGMILVFGLGLDYIIYMTENFKKKESFWSLESFAVILSFMTTALSFGALALSFFVPVHVIGLSILAGLTAAYFASL